MVGNYKMTNEEFLEQLEIAKTKYRSIGRLSWC